MMLGSISVLMLLLFSEHFLSFVAFFCDVLSKGETTEIGEGFRGFEEASPYPTPATPTECSPYSGCRRLHKFWYLYVFLFLSGKEDVPEYRH